MTVVLLAAGRSSRTSDLKSLYRVEGEYLINRQIRQLRSYGYDVAVVLGHAFDQISAILPDGVKVIRNEVYEEGMFSSVKRAFETLDAPELYFCQVDRPVPDKRVFEALSRSNSAVATAFFEGHRAPPQRISAVMRSDLLASDAGRLDAWIEATGIAEAVDVDDPKVVLNANTDEELRRIFG
ncbi:NTP transferase domain-containing protein [Sulfurimonas sp. HSL-1656]|uniref:nucleotidyltransferase family protein n=1 Tax=Thiomicrolovo subterrani TaxID=3131934 RepID=UPI0031F8D91B